VEWTPFREQLLEPFDFDSDLERPIAGTPTHFYFGDSSLVLRRRTVSGRVAWHSKLIHDSAVFHELADDLVVAGAHGLSRVRQSDGSVVWRVRIDDGPAMPGAVPIAPFPTLEEKQPHRTLDAVRIAGSCVVAQRGQREVLAFDLESGTCQWCFRLPKDGADDLIEGSIATLNHRVLLRSASGELHCLRVDDGKLLFRLPAPTPWLSGPVAVDDQTFLYADGPILRAVDISTGVERWRYAPTNVHSLAGSSLQAMRDGSQVLVVVERNYGWEFERLHLDGRRELGTIFVGRDPVDLSRSASIGSIHALHVGDRIIALDRDRGGRLWSRPVSSPTPWRVRAARNVLMLSADFASAHHANNMRDGNDRSVALPTQLDLRRRLGRAYYASVDRTFPVTAIDPANGKDQYAESFPAIGPRAALRVVDGKVWVCVEGRMIPLSANRN
jgi:outer membrane protein assembly factor BamB